MLYLYSMAVGALIAIILYWFHKDASTYDWRFYFTLESLYNGHRGFNWTLYREMNHKRKLCKVCRSEDFDARVGAEKESRSIWACGVHSAAFCTYNLKRQLLDVPLFLTWFGIGSLVCAKVIGILGLRFISQFIPRDIPRAATIDIEFDALLVTMILVLCVVNRMVRVKLVEYWDPIKKPYLDILKYHRGD